MKNTILVMEQLEERLRYWQARLRLQDWSIEIMFDRGYNMGTDLAKIHIMEDKRRARIRMMEENDYDPCSLLPYDMEQVLIHELLHIHFWPLTKDEGSNVTPEEQAIEAISWALIGLERRADRMEEYYEAELAKRPLRYLTGGAQIIDIRTSDEEDGGPL